MLEPMEDDLVMMTDDEYGIMHVIFKERFEFNGEDARKYLQLALKFSKGVPKYLLLDITKISYFDLGALKELTSPLTEHYTKASAVIVSMSSPVVAIGASFLVNLKKEPFPIKVFTENKEGIKWLLELMEEEKNKDQNKSNTK